LIHRLKYLLDSNLVTSLNYQILLFT